MSHDLQLFSSDIHFNRENCDRKHPASIRRPGTSPEGLLKVFKSKTCSVLSGDSQVTNIKIDGFMKKLFF